MHTRVLIEKNARADAREKEQAVRLANIAGVAAAEERVSPELTATVRFGDPNLAALIEKEARIDLIEEALTKLEAQDISGDAPITSIRELEGVGPDLADKLEASGFQTPEDIRDASVEELTEVQGVGEAKAKKLKAEVEG